MTIKKRRYFSMCIVLVFVMIFTSLPLDSVYAVMDEVNEPSQVTTFSSSTTFSSEYCKATVSGSKMKIRFRTMIPSYEFRLAVYGVYPATKLNDLGITIPAIQVATSSSGSPIYGFEYTIDFSNYELENGDYFIYVSQINDVNDTYETSPSSGALYKNLSFVLKNGVPKIYRYKDVMAENAAVEAIGADYDPNWYLDNYLDDIRFVLKIPGTTTYEEMSSYKVEFIKNLSNRITTGAYSDYDKLLKIYDYVTGNFYYDSVAFSTHSYQYANPYNNLYNFENKIASPNSDSEGRVATTCQGYSAMFLALARAQGISTRFVYGHRATSPINNWGTENDIEVRDHWWVESYVNGRWIFIDPTIGTNNRWNKNTNKWTYFGVTNHTYFDPSEEQIAVSHIYHNIYPDKRYGYLITDENEITKLTTFLDALSKNESNGSIMNSAYNRYDKTTWGDGYKTHFMGDGYGNTTRLRWNDFDFTGDIDFSGFTKLNYFSMSANKLTSINLSNCTKLNSVYVYNNKLTSIDLSNCKNLKIVNTSGNLLKTASIYANGRNVNITAGDNGAFYIKYSSTAKNRLGVIFKPDIGYKVSGFYNGSGNKITAASPTSYSMNPGYQTYSLKFTLDPDSYKYLLYTNHNDTTYIPYNKAAQERLTALGYYTGEVKGYYYEDTEDAVAVFQRANGVEVTGKINKETWSKLFNTAAIRRPTDEALASITEINNLKLFASATISKGKVKLTWSNISSEDELISSSAVTVGGYQIWKSTSSTTGYKKLASTKNLSYTNKSGLTKGKTYYYKIRAYKYINGKVYYSQWTIVKAKAK